MIPTFQKPMQKYLGWRVDGVGTTWLAGALRPDRELRPELAEAIQIMIDDGYHDFISRVAEARDMTLEEVDRIGRGRVWSGEDAHQLGLVDRLGGLEEAIASAAELAGLGDDYAVRYVEKGMSIAERMALQFLSRTAAWLGPDLGAVRNGSVAAVRQALFDILRREAETLAGLNDPNGVYALCFCEVE